MMGDDGNAAGDTPDVGFGYREQTSGAKRRARTAVLYTDLEWSAIVAAAAVAGKKPGAWVATVAYETARRENTGAVLDRDVAAGLITQLREQRRVLTNIGNNVNTMARAVHSTGELGAHPNAAQSVLGLIARSVRSLDTLVGDVRQALLS